MNKKAFYGIIKLPNNVWCIGFFIKTTKTRAIRAQTVLEVAETLTRANSHFVCAIPRFSSQ